MNTTNNDLIKEAKRLKREYEKQTGQTFPLQSFIDVLKERINKQIEFKINLN